MFIEARNRYGIARMHLGEIVLYDLPSFNVDLNYLPRPQIPDIEPFSVERVGSGAGRACARAGTRSAAGATLRTLDLIETLMPGTAVSVPAPRIQDAVIEASNAVVSIITSEAEEYAAARRTGSQGRWRSSQ